MARALGSVLHAAPPYIVYTELDFEDRSWTVRDDRQSGTVSRFEATELNGCRSTFRAAPVLPSSSFSSKLLACCSSFRPRALSRFSLSPRAIARCTLLFGDHEECRKDGVQSSRLGSDP